jgi:hypothetical protein
MVIIIIITIIVIIIVIMIIPFLWALWSKSQAVLGLLPRLVYRRFHPQKNQNFQQQTQNDKIIIIIIIKRYWKIRKVEEWAQYIGSVRRVLGWYWGASEAQRVTCLRLWKSPKVSF